MWASRFEARERGGGVVDSRSSTSGESCLKVPCHPSSPGVDSGHGMCSPAVRASKQVAPGVCGEAGEGGGSAALPAVLPLTAACTDKTSFCESGSWLVISQQSPRRSTLNR